jgi:hypothetical protein
MKTKLSKNDLILVLKDIINELELDDSFEGFLNYTYLDDELSQEEIKNNIFMVDAFYRVGNREGQGGCRIVGDRNDN